MEDLSKRELERYLRKNNEPKWFCGFDLTESTPSFTVFGRIRNRIVTNRLSGLFGDLEFSLATVQNNIFDYVQVFYDN